MGPPLRGRMQQDGETVQEDALRARLAELESALAATAAERDRLGEMERRYSALLGAMPDLFFLVDREGNYLEVAAAEPSKLAVPLDEVVGAGIGDIPLDARDAERLKEAIARALDVGSPQTVEYELATPEGAGHWEARFARLDGQRAIAIVRDVTERKRAEEERYLLKERMERSARTEGLGLLASGVAHDFNNLLTGILGYAEIALAELDASDPARERVARIAEETRRAADVVQQILTYVGKGRSAVESVDLSALVGDLAHLLEITTSRRASLRMRLDPSIPRIDADPAQIRQIVLNLAINAAEAIRTDGGAIEIRTGVSVYGESALSGVIFDKPPIPGRYTWLEVSDDGEGMEKAVLSRIFDPFYTTKPGGRGLGLAAVRGIARVHGCGIDVHSELGRGTRFRVLFPVGTERVPPRSAEAPAPPVEPSETGAWLLVVDDEPTIRTVASEILTRQGFTVLTAGDGQSALEIFHDHAPKIRAVLLDLTMPILDGPSAFAELRRLKPDIKVVFFSGYEEGEMLARVRDIGHAGFLRKPFRARELLEALRAELAG